MQVAREENRRRQISSIFFIWQIVQNNILVKFMQAIEPVCAQQDNGTYYYLLWYQLQHMYDVSTVLYTVVPALWITESLLGRCAPIPGLTGYAHNNGVPRAPFGRTRDSCPVGGGEAGSIIGYICCFPRASCSLRPPARPHSVPFPSC